MDTQEQQRTQKQSYLRETILEAGYSPQHFIEFLEGTQKQSADIDCWSLEELKEEVANYKQNQEGSLEKTSPRSGTEPSESLEGNTTKDLDEGSSGKHKESADMEAAEEKGEDNKGETFGSKTQSKLITTKKPMSNMEGNINGIITE
eukprot:TRINITY_DN3068_c0_g1_i15.p5 TRINITY_DN3068_c0_g1~~TRINITY_DN3068_c0_g1_i15.p5  ORF type:complete len:147 (+),score=55.57 TRINITY_DN3068_c0_g1_i15:1638-2078(+)